MSESLRNLLVESSALEDKLIELAGELTPELETSLMSLELKIPQKVTNYCRLLDRLEMEAENLYTKSEKYGTAAKVLINLKDRLLANVKSNMIENQLLELRGIDENFALSKGKQSVLVNNLSALPREFIVQTITERPDKEKIYNSVKSGEQVPGVELQETVVLKRRINKGIK